MTVEREVPAPHSESTGSIAVVVSSCDAFFDCWRPFAFFFRKFWPDCPFPVFLIVNELEIRSELFRPLRVGPDQGWATNMKIALEQIDAPYILYFQEDYLLTAPVDRDQLESDLAHAMDEDVASFCFTDLALLEPELVSTQERFSVIPQESKGRTRLQVTLWKKDVFASLLQPGEDAWNMEARGSERARDLVQLSYGPMEAPPISYLMSGIVRGLWTPEARALCHAHHLTIRPRFRPDLVLTKWRRRWRRAIGRTRLAQALAAQRGRPVDLDWVD